MFSNYNELKKQLLIIKLAEENSRVEFQKYRKETETELTLLKANIAKLLERESTLASIVQDLKDEVFGPKRIVASLRGRTNRL